MDLIWHSHIIHRYLSSCISTLIIRQNLLILIILIELHALMGVFAFQFVPVLEAQKQNTRHHLLRDCPVVIFCENIVVVQDSLQL